MPPRIHNTLSYSLAAVVFLCVMPWERAAAALVAALWVFHFARRTLESLFVHRYSGRRVPPADYWVEYAYYGGFAAAIAWAVGQAGWALPRAWPTLLGVGVFLGGEAGNAWAHQKLRALRSAPGEVRKQVPHGGTFEWVSCPHYLFEITSWAGFALVTRVLPAYVFLALGAGIVTSYAFARHRKYKAEFDGQDGKELYPKGRRAIFPGIF